MIESHEFRDSSEILDKKSMRAAMEISSFIADTDIKVLPGKEWGVYYKEPERRQKICKAF